MTNHQIKTIALLSATALCLGPAALGQADAGSEQRAGSTTNETRTSTGSTSESWMNSDEQIRVVGAATDTSGRTLNDYQGQKVTGSDGQDLGTIRDFLVDTKSGRIKGAAISSGGVLGVGDNLRVVKHNKLEHTPGVNGFTTEIDKAAFEAMPVVSEEDLDAGRFHLASTAGAQASSQIDTSSASTSTARESESSSEHMAKSKGQIMRASKLDGMDVQAGGEQVGEIEKIVLDLEHGKVRAVLDAEREFAGSDDDFLVPLSELQFSSADADFATTTLNRDDFASARATTPDVASTTTEDSPSPTGRTTTDESSSSVVGTSTPSSTAGLDTEYLTPTGRSSSEQLTSTGANQDLVATSSAIRAAFDSDSSLSREDVRVMPSGDKIVLRGTVSSEEAKQKAEDLARKSAKNAEIKNELEVEK